MTLKQTLENRTEGPATVWKVVRRPPGGILRSAVPCRRLTVMYKPRVKTKAKVGCLFAFASQEEAQDFAWRRALGNSLEIWQAEARGVCPAPDLIPSLCLPVERLIEFWKGNMEAQIKVPAPPGTLLCEEITLIKRSP